MVQQEPWLTREGGLFEAPRRGLKRLFAPYPPSSGVALRPLDQPDSRPSGLKISSKSGPGFNEMDAPLLYGINRARVEVMN
jgi:hypothetical protein